MTHTLSVQLLFIDTQALDDLQYPVLLSDYPFQYWTDSSLLQ